MSSDAGQMKLKRMLGSAGTEPHETPDEIMSEAIAQPASE
jgi:hypothetical protein